MSLALNARSTVEEPLKIPYGTVRTAVRILQSYSTVVGSQRPTPAAMSHRKSYPEGSLSAKRGAQESLTSAYKSRNRSQDPSDGRNSSSDPRTRKRNVALRGVYDGFDVERSGFLKLEQIRTYGSQFESLVGQMEDAGDYECDISLWLEHFNKATAQTLVTKCPCLLHFVLDTFLPYFFID